MRRTPMGRTGWIGAFAAFGCAALAACADSSSGGRPAALPPQATVDLSQATVFLELNATDEDLGIHSLFDGEGWTRMTIVAPNGVVIFSVTNGGTLSRIGSTEVFTESAEPPFSVLPPRDFLALFPEGTYTFDGLTVGGRRLVGRFDLDHQMPSMPVIDTTPPPDSVSASGPLTIQWTLDPILPGGGALMGGADIEKLQVIVDQTDPLDVDPQLILSVDLPAGATEFTVPAGVLVAGREAKVEVLAIGENGNKTAAELGIGMVQP